MLHQEISRYYFFQKIKLRHEFQEFIILQSESLLQLDCERARKDSTRRRSKSADAQQCSVEGWRRTYAECAGTLHNSFKDTPIDSLAMHAFLRIWQESTVLIVVVLHHAAFDSFFFMLHLMWHFFRAAIIGIPNSTELGERKGSKEFYSN